MITKRIVIFVAAFILGANALGVSESLTSNDILRRMKEFEERDKKRETELETLRKQNTEMADDMDLLRKQNKDTLREMDQLYKQKVDMSGEIKQLHKQNADMENEMKQLHKQTGDMSDELDILGKQNIELFEEIKHLKVHDIEKADVIATLVGHVDALMNSFVMLSNRMEYSTANEADSKINGEAENIKTPLKGNYKLDNIHPLIGHGHNRIRQAEWDSMPVAFYVTASNNTLHMGQDQPITFDNVITNIGKAYLKVSGAFIAPVDGIYVFSTTILGHQETKHYAFAVNGQVMSRLYVHAAINEYQTTSQTAIFILNRGDDVTIRNVDPDRWLFGYHYSTFSGFLLASNITPTTSQPVG